MTKGKVSRGLVRELLNLHVRVWTILGVRHQYTYHKYDTFYIYIYIKTLWVFIYMHVLFQNSCTNMRPYALWNRGASVEQGAVPCSTLYLRKVRDREIWCSLSPSLRCTQCFPDSFNCFWKTWYKNTQEILWKSKLKQRQYEIKNVCLPDFLNKHIWSHSGWFINVYYFIYHLKK